MGSYFSRASLRLRECNDLDLNFEIGMFIFLSVKPPAYPTVEGRRRQGRRLKEIRKGAEITETYDKEGGLVQFVTCLTY